MRSLATVLSLLVLLAPAACTRSPEAREYELRGQVLAVSPERGELTIKHEDIKGFMPAMTMPFKVREAKLLDGRVAGDLVTATLVVEDTNAYLTSVERTGHAPVTEAPPAAPPSVMLQPGSEVPDVKVTDQDGAARRLSDWRGRVVAVTFIYTRCPLPNFCPLMDRQFADVQKALHADAGLKKGTHLVSVSFNPAFDTPAVLAEHAVRAGADPATWSFVTGDRADIERFASSFGVSVIREDADMKEIVHNLRTAVIDPQGRLVQVFNGSDWTPADLLASMRRAGD